MKKKLFALLLAAVVVAGLFAGCGSTKKEPSAPAEEGSTTESTPEAGGEELYPAGTAVIYGHGNPQFLMQYYEPWIERNRDIAPEVSIEIVQTEGAADSREKITMTYLSGAFEDLPDAVFIDPVNLMDLAEGGIIIDQTDFVTPYVDKLVDGAINDATFGGRTYGLPESVRPQVLFYNQSIFEEYGVDPAQMSTMEGYLEAGRQLKEKSDGKVYLSYIDPGDKTWRYWGRRGLMPQAGARIWDEEGNVIIGEDAGAARAFGMLDTMYQEDLLMKTTIMEPALYDAMGNHQVATFNIGAFWDEFIRQNVPETSGEWRVMPSPAFEEVGTAGAPVASYFAVLNKEDAGVYAGLMQKLWTDFTFENEPRIEWVNAMVEQNAPYANPISLEMLEDPFWQEPSDFYGGQSFRQAEGEGLENSSANLVVTPQDAEADTIITAELEKYVAGDQTMEQAIANMDQHLKDKIGQADISR